MTEHDLQCAVADYLGVVCPHPWSALEHGGNNSVQRGAKLKRQGVKPGLPDLLIFTPTGTVSIELKSPKGRQTPDQKALGDWLNQQPAHAYSVCRSVDEVAEALKHWGVVR